MHNLNFCSKGLKGFELDERAILDSGKFTILNSLLEEKKELVSKIKIYLIINLIHFSFVFF